jgi:hypothetical protein
MLSDASGQVNEAAPGKRKGPRPHEMSGSPDDTNGAAIYLTLTLRSAVDQQHTSPPPPNPE